MSDKIQDASGLVLSCLPPHACELSITHNQHKNAYETVEEYLANWVHIFGCEFHAEWASEDERALAIATNELWVMQWYQRTPNGFCATAAASLGALLVHAAKLRGWVEP